MKQLKLIIMLMLFPLGVVLFLITCQDYEDKEYTIASLDFKGCEYLTRDLILVDTLYTEEGEIDTVLIDTLFKSITTSVLRDLVDTTWANSSDSTIISLFFDSLSTKMDTLIRDTTLKVDLPLEVDTSYAFYFNSNINIESERVFFIGEFVDIDIIDKDGASVNVVTTNIPLETIAGCTEIVEEGGSEEVVSVIKSRYAFQLKETDYLVRFVKSDAAGDKPFLVTILVDD
ncbi:MAG: hypothetical protein ACE5EE_05595 [Fidelibacterota bacterium]